MTIWQYHDNHWHSWIATCIITPNSTPYQVEMPRNQPCHVRFIVHVVVPKEPTSCAELASSDGSLRRWKPFNLQNGQCHLQPDPFPAAHHHRWRWWFPVGIPDAPIACPPGRSEQPDVVDWFRDRVDSGCQYSMVICKYDSGNKVWKLHERIWQLRFRKQKVRILALWHFLGHVYFRGTRDHDRSPPCFKSIE